MPKLKKTPIVIATKNLGKIKEIKSFFQDIKSIKWLTYKDIKNFPDVEEGTDSFLENAKTKAKKISEFTGNITIADDSGLEVDLLKGKPGVISSIYAGRGATDKENRLKLLEELSNYLSFEQRTARFICYIVVWHPKIGMICKSEGICNGNIGFNEIGVNGFGYDCIFIPEGYTKTMAQLSEKEKNQISHRGKALKNLRECLEKITFGFF